MSVKVEFVGGGPVDGRVQEFPDGMPIIRIYTPRQEVGAYVNIEDADSKSPIHHHDTHAYRREDRITPRGTRAYTYAGKERT